MFGSRLLHTFGSFTLAGLSVVQASGVNYALCLDWEPSLNPGLNGTNFTISTQFAPSGTYINCINGGRGTMSLDIIAGTNQGRYCSSSTIFADTSENDCDHGVFAVTFDGPSSLTGSRRIGVQIDDYCSSDGITYLCTQQSSAMFANTSNIVICQDPGSNNCDYANFAGRWSYSSVANVGLVWQPNGMINSQVPADLQAPFEIEL